MECFSRSLLQVPEMREKLIANNKDKWKAIAELHATTILFPPKEEVQRYAKRYHNDHQEQQRFTMAFVAA